MSASKIGAVPVDAIEARHVKRVLSPIAAAGPMNTVTRVGDRIAQTLEWARIEGYYAAPNPVKAVVRCRHGRTTSGEVRRAQAQGRGRTRGRGFGGLVRLGFRFTRLNYRTSHCR